jgi:hypothetical protein
MGAVLLLVAVVREGAVLLVADLLLVVVVREGTSLLVAVLLVGTGVPPSSSIPNLVAEGCKRSS